MCCQIRQVRSSLFFATLQNESFSFLCSVKLSKSTVSFSLFPVDWYLSAVWVPGEVGLALTGSLCPIPRWTCRLATESGFCFLRVESAPEHYGTWALWMMAHRTTTLGWSWSALTMAHRLESTRGCTSLTGNSNNSIRTTLKMPLETAKLHAHTK